MFTARVSASKARTTLDICWLFSEILEGVVVFFRLKVWKKNWMFSDEGHGLSEEDSEKKFFEEDSERNVAEDFNSFLI